MSQCGAACTTFAPLAKNGVELNARRRICRISVVAAKACRNLRCAIRHDEFGTKRSQVQILSPRLLATQVIGNK